MMGSYSANWLVWVFNLALVLGLWALSVAAIIAAIRAWGGGDEDGKAAPFAGHRVDDPFAAHVDAEQSARHSDIVRSGR